MRWRRRTRAGARLPRSLPRRTSSRSARRRRARRRPGDDRPAPMRLARLAAATLAVVAVANAPGAAASAASAATVRVIRNIQYGVAGGAPLLVDAYLPAAGGLYPAVVAIHGGAWWSGDKSEWATSCRQLAAVGFACFSVNYRLAPRYPYPAAVDDVTAATRWIRENADRYGVDRPASGPSGAPPAGTSPR